MWQREVFNHLGDDGVRSSLNASDLLNTPFIYPPITEQKKIVDYLNDKCTEIEAVLEKTRASIDEYKQLKHSVITQAVTKGIRGDRPMKDSGIEWIGEIPKEWIVRKGKWFLKLLDRPVVETDGVITCFRDGEVTLRSNRREEGFTFSLQEVGYQGIEKGDLVVHGMDGFAGAIGISDSRGKGTPVLNVLDSLECKKYVMYYLRSMAYNGVFISLSTGIRVRSCDTNWNKLRNLLYPLPSLQEQVEIASYLDAKCAEIDNLISKKEQYITEIENYKKSLIYEYVTGKKEWPAINQNDDVSNTYPYFPAPVHASSARFAQAVLMSKILEESSKGMGRVKLEKTLFTIENHIGFNFDTEYLREAAGPLDASIYECEKIITRRNKWFSMKTSSYGVSYAPTNDVDKYKKYYAKYFSEYNSEIERIIDVFRNYTTEQAEIIATLFAAWNDAIIDKKQFTDDDIVDDVLNNWHESKRRFPRQVWLRAMNEIRKNHIIPKGYGKHTVMKEMQ